MKRVELIASLDIGACIKTLREAKGLSQEELAKGICDRTNITKLENGHSKIPSLTFVLLICEKLGLTIEEFLNKALNNSYSLNKNLVLDILMKKDYITLSSYMDTINYEILSLKDQKYYLYLKGLIASFNNHSEIAYNYFITIVNNHKSYISMDYIEVLAYHQLVKLKMSEGFDIEDFYSKEHILKILERNSPLEYIYLLDDLAVTDKYYLEKEIEFINSHECYKYLSNFYQNKIELYKDDYNAIRDIKGKLLAIGHEIK